ncbi:MAG: translation elongation factor Ts [Anaerolineae bacterium]|nr:translation elongation factor Ts [Phycisphaerae bacterium]
MSATITASMVNELRSKTGLGMMECKKALTEANGDTATAIDNLRKKGVKTSITERQAGEGRVVASSAEHGRLAVAVEVNCTTDFAAKSDAFGKLLELALHKLLANPNADVRNDAEVKSAVVSTAQQTGENVQIGKAIAIHNPEGYAGAYVYAITNKIAVLMGFGGEKKPDAEVMKQLGGHIAFAKPLGLTRDAVPADLVAKEREIAVDQAKQTGKPQAIAEKIAEGKLNSFFAERVLLDQEFFNAGVFKGSVQNYLKQHGVTLTRYERIEVGQQ